MRRFRPRPPGALFRGSELVRFVTVIVMFGVVFLLFSRAKDASTWRWLVTDAEPSNGGPVESASPGLIQTADDRATTAVHGLSATATEPAGATDLDADELEQARWEFQAVEDKSPLLREEMPSYWRLVSWIRRQPAHALAERARRDVLFTHLMESPAKRRGELIRVRLHLMRSLRHEADENKIGVKWLYEAWGWSNDSQPWPYVVIFPDWPRGMPLGADIREEASVDGYFLKLMAYRAHDDKRRVAPLLIGRLTWHPSPLRTSDEASWFWPIVLAGGGILLLCVGVRLYSSIFRCTLAGGPTPATSVATEQWLGQIESRTDLPETPNGNENDDEYPRTS